MPMTITEKILAAHAGKSEVHPGELIEVRVDLALANDITAPLAIRVFQRMGADRVFDPEKVALIQDHFVPNKDIDSAEQARVTREFSREQGLKHFYEIGEAGIEHVMLPERGMVVPGDVVIGADSHTCTYGGLGAFSSGVGSTDLAGVMATGEIWVKVPPTIRLVFEGNLGRWVQGKDLILHAIGLLGVEGARYRSLEFTGPVIEALSMEGRLTMANMAVEAGAKNGIVPPDQVTRAYVAERSSRVGEYCAGDPGAEYERVIHISVDGLQPVVACPNSPDNTAPVPEVRDVRIDQVFIGSCTNGRIEDLRSAAQVLAGRQRHKDVRVIVVPGSPLVYRQALNEGLFQVFLDAGAVIGPPTCGPCLGGHMGVLAKKERAVSTSNRNFVGRMGHPESEVYLANPAVAAASAILGRVASPEEL